MFKIKYIYIYNYLLKIKKFNLNFNIYTIPFYTNILKSINLNKIQHKYMNVKIQEVKSTIKTQRISSHTQIKGLWLDKDGKPI